MTATESPSPKSSKKKMRQKRDRRRKGLMKKAHEYSEMCGADVCLGIRIRDTGRLFIFSADPSGFWEFDSYYPVPTKITEKDLEQKK